MKTKMTFPLLVVCLLALSLSGCAKYGKNLGVLEVSKPTTVEDNLFSSSFPEIKLQINRGLRYLGNAPLIKPDPSGVFSSDLDRDSMRSGEVEATSYLFGEIDRNNRISRGVLIRILVVYGAPNRGVPDVFSKRGMKILDSGDTKILDGDFAYDLYTKQDFFAAAEKDLLAGALAPDCVLARALSSTAVLGNKSQVQVIYFEDLSDACGTQSCGTCLDPQGLTGPQNQVMAGFNERSFASIRFLDTKNTMDSTFRYVDVQPGASPAPGQRNWPATAVVPPPPPSQVETAPPAVGSTKLDTLEKRLEALKRIYEKNLISKEDYEKKKAEIMKEF